MKISIIVAKTKNNAIGKNNCMPWHLKADLQHFKEITSGHPVIMGRKCFESIGKALPNRTNIIITHDHNYEADGCIIKSSLQAAMDYAVSLNNSEVFIIGGGTIYRQILNTGSVDNIYLTEIDTIIDDADTFFPELNEKYWDKYEIGSVEKDKDNDYAMKFYKLEYNIE